jgi:iron(III) transport system substrate-binding protein
MVANVEYHRDASLGKRHPMLPRIAYSRIGLLLIAGSLACLPGADAQTEDAQQQLAAGASREGVVTVLSTTDLEEVGELLSGFRALYPSLRLEYKKENSTIIDERIRREAKGSGISVDLVWSSAMDLQLKLVNDGYAEAHDSPAREALPNWAVWKNQAYGVTAEPIGIAYNKRLLSPAQAPRSHADLLRFLRDGAGSLAGRIATYDPERSSVGYLLLMQDLLVTDRTWSLIDAMGLVRVRLFAASGEMLDRVAAGEAVLAYNVIGSYALDRARSTPELGVVLPADYTLVMSRVALIPKGAPHPTAARLFLDYLLSAPGQKALAAHAIGSVRGDITADAVAAVPPEAARPIQLGLRLLASLDQAKRTRFMRDWQALVSRQAAR